MALAGLEVKQLGTLSPRLEGLEIQADVDTLRAPAMSTKLGRVDIRKCAEIIMGWQNRVHTATNVDISTGSDDCIHKLDPACTNIMDEVSLVILLFKV